MLEENPIAEESPAHWALLGERKFRPLQEAAVALMREGINTLAVFGTGQGKSVIFQIPAVEDAFLERKTIIFYPLRSLANDQYAVMKEALADLPIKLVRANGGIEEKERATVDHALDTGEWDIMIATPEFVTHHIERFSRACNLPYRIVVDEAHHLYESRHRPAYRGFEHLIERLGNPKTAAFTATAGKEAFTHILRVLRIGRWVINPAVRENLKIIDARNTKKKPEYLEELCEKRDGKTIVYCSKVSDTLELAARLSARFAGVGYYNAKMPRELRVETEDGFRNGKIRFLIATSAFGEGIDIPDVRDVVLYQLNYDFVSFNQMAGRAGRDGADARIHLLFNEEDRKINDFVMSLAAPSKDLLRQIYNEFRRWNDNGEIRATYADINRTLQLRGAKEQTYSIAARIFEQVGLAKLGRNALVEGDKIKPFIRLLKPVGLVDIESAPLYTENQMNLINFEAFCKVALRGPVSDLEHRIARPIYPKHLPLEGAPAST